MSIQILHYEFLGPIKLSEWGPPMEKVVYLIMSRNKDGGFNIIFADACEKTEKNDFFTQNDKFKCWIKHGGNEENLYLAILPMFEAENFERNRVADKIVLHYKPVCNSESEL